MRSVVDSNCADYRVAAASWNPLLPFALLVRHKDYFASRIFKLLGDLHEDQERGTLGQ